MKSFDPKAYASMPKISFVDNLISVLFQICNDLWNVYSSSNKECVHVFDPLVPEKKKMLIRNFHFRWSFRFDALLRNVCLDIVSCDLFPGITWLWFHQVMQVLFSSLFSLLLFCFCKIEEKKYKITVEPEPTAINVLNKYAVARKRKKRVGYIII